MKRMLMAIVAIMSWSVLADTWVDTSTRIEWTYWVSPDNEIEVQEISHYQENGKATVNQSASFGDLKIPSTIKGLPVKSISGFMFVDKNVDSVWMPDSIVKIGDGAFKQNWVTNIHLSASLISIGDEAFLGCQLTTGLYLPSGVTELGIRVFEDCHKITSITIPDGITEIPEGTLSACSGLTNVVLHEGITSIGDRAFCSCTALTKIDLPSTVTRIGREAFGGCCKVKSIAIPSGVETIPDGLFTGCLELEYINLPDTIRTIGDWSLSNCAKLKTVNLNDNITSIGYSAFGYNESFTSIRIPEKVTILSDYLFRDCVSLVNVELSPNITTIGENAFLNCRSIKHIDLPSGLTGHCQFDGCDNLLEIEIPEGVTSFRLAGCYALRYVSVPSTVSELKNSSFGWASHGNVGYSCGNIKMVSFHGDAPKTNAYSFGGSPMAVSLSMVVSVPEGSSGWDDDGDGKWNGFSIVYRKPDGGPYKETIDGIEWTYTVFGGEACIGDGKGSCAIQSSISGAITIPSVLGGCIVRKIGDKALYGCSRVTAITIPLVVRSVGLEAFSSCANLMSIIVDGDNQNYKSQNGLLLTKDGTTLVAGMNAVATIPECVTNIADCAFCRCYNLTSVTIPDGVVSIGSNAFFCCSLSEVILPKSVTSIGRQAFSCCSVLSGVYFEGDAPSVGESVFDWVHSSCTAYVKKSSSGWNVAIPGTWNGINIAYYAMPDGGPYKEAVDGVEWTYRVEYGESIISSGEECKSAIDKNLHTDIVVPSTLGGRTVKVIGEYAFYDCWLKSVTVPEGVREVKENAFKQCCMTSIVLPETLETIGREAFRSCYFLTSITFPSGVTRIEEAAFRDCPALTSITIPAVHYVGPEAFAWCEKLESVDINADITEHSPYWEWPYGVFSGCSALTNVTFGSNMTCIWPMMFSDCTALTSITIPETITQIGEYAFYRSGLLRVDIPDNVVSIDNKAFAECKCLKEAILSEELETLKWCVFQQCSELTSIKLPSSITTIESSVFEDCSKLSTITFDGLIAPTSSGAFVGVQSGCTIYVNKDSSGWGVEIPGTWDGINIAYYTAYEVEGAGEVKIHDDWVQKYAPGKSEAEVTELLAQPAANGTYKNWECYVLGLDPTNENSKLELSAPQSQDSDTISVALNVNVPAGCGYTVSNEVTVTGGSGGGHGVTALPGGFTIDLSGDDDPSGLYTIKVKLVPDGSSASTSEFDVEQTVGVRKSTSELTKTAIAVPWGELTGSGVQAICVSNLVKTANLSAGDKLYVYNMASRAYETWQLSGNKTWEPLATYVILEDGTVSKTSAGAPTTTMVARGSAVWLERQDTSKPFYLYGEYKAGTIETSIVGGTTETPVWNFVAPPTLGGYDLNNITGASEDDKIVVTTANGPKIYTYKDGAWGSDVNTTVTRTLPSGGTIEVVKKTRDTTNTTIAAGTGFMYVSQGGAPTIQW